MSDSIRLHIAYHESNESFVKQLQNELDQFGCTTSLIKSNEEVDYQEFSTEVSQVKEPVVLIVSDNYLKSTPCMHQSLDLLQRLSSERLLFPVVIDGTYPQEDGSMQQVETRFQRVSDVIQYMNYWQNQYLDLRKLKRDIPEDQEEGFSSRLRTVRTISAEIGEFLRHLRVIPHALGEELMERELQPLFKYLGKEPQKTSLSASTPPAPEMTQETEPVETPTPEVAEDAEKAQPEVAEEAPVAIEDIPGMELLEPELETTDDEGEVEPELETPVSEETEEPEKMPLLHKLVEHENAKHELNGAKQFLDRAEELLKEEQADAAMEIYKEGLDAYPNSPDLRYKYALTLLKHDRNLEESTRQLEKVREIQPSNHQATFLLAELAEVQERTQEARGYYEAVAEVNPDFPEIYYRLGMLTLNQEPENYPLAAKYFKKAVKKNKKNADAHYRYAILLHEKMDRLKKAIKHFQKTLKYHPDHPFANYDLATIYHEHGEYQMAYHYYQDAIKINPELKTPENDAAFAVPAATPASEPAEEVVPEARAEEKREQKTTSTGLVMITGATSGIGLATAKLFAQSGYNLILTGRRQDRLQSIAEELSNEYGVQVTGLVFDVRDHAAAKRAWESLDPNWQEIDLLINNAGLAKGLAPIQEGEVDHWETMIDTNIKGLLYMTRLISPGMVERKSGHIINVCSTAGKEVYPKGNVYCATKFAVDALTKGMRLDLYQHNIRVSQVSPAHVEETEFALVRFDGDAEKAKIYEDFQPLRSSDVAATIHFIASQPAHVNIQDVLMMGTQQAGSTFIDRSGR